ncbi:HET domain-containing protein [Microdochium nivale]|nr:HET domain-containing protein [Microdochium nivale]
MPPCPICLDFKGTTPLTRRGSGFMGNRHHHKLGLTWAELEASAAATPPCHCCKVLVRGCVGLFWQHGISTEDVVAVNVNFFYQAFEGQDEMESTDMDKELRCRLKNGKVFEVQLFAHEEGEYIHFVGACFRATLTRSTDGYPIPDAWESIPVYGQTCPNTGSKEALAKFQGWLAECRQDHDCVSNEDMPFPSRLVDVGINDGVVRVVETKGQHGKYLCLSHCWGPLQIITTTTATYDQRKTGISLDDLSQTFRDAVLLTRRLGVQYIWIDSLCIIQDSLTDWQMESAQMASIYSNAYLTLAATKSSSGAGGFYTDTPTTEISGTTPEGEKYSIFFRQRIDHHLEATKTGVETVMSSDRNGTDSNRTGYEFAGHATLENHPLLTRAWVYQERLLSRRLLHFGPHELFFECEGDVNCECGQIRYHGSSTGSPTSAVKLLYAEAVSSYFGATGDSTGSANSGEDFDGMQWSLQHQEFIARTWRTLVSSYVALDLTKSEDRLPAIGGVARQMSTRRFRDGRMADGAEAYHDDYLAGLWRATLNDDLLWIVSAGSDLKKPRPPPVTIRNGSDNHAPTLRTIPSWSWASIDSHALYTDVFLFWDPEVLADIPRQPYTHFAAVESCSVEPAGLDEFGAIASGELRVRGLVARGTLVRETRNRDGDEQQDQHGVEGGLVLCRHFVTVSRIDGVVDKFAMDADYLLDDQGPDQVSPGTEVLCLRMSVVLEGSTDRLISLVLRPSPRRDKAYERIGSLSINAKPPPVDCLGGGLYADAQEETVVIV